MFRIILFAMLLFSITNAHAQVHTATPPLGWNSWDSYGKFPTEQAMLANIQAMAQKLKSFGYTYFVVDGGWNLEKDTVAHKVTGFNIDKWGRPLPAKTAFPNGMKIVADSAHRAKLQFGIHILRGIPRQAYYSNLPVYNTTYKAKDITDTTSVCPWNKDNFGINMSKPGAQEYYDSFISLLAGWGVNFIKADDLTNHPDEIKAIQLAIQKTGKAILLSLSPGNYSIPAYIDSYKPSATLRITPDIWDNQRSIDTIFYAWKTWSSVSFDSLWPDMDMIPFGHLCLNNSDPNYMHAAPREGDKGVKGKERITSFSKDQQYTFITILALGGSPLFMGGDLPTLDSFSFALLTNKKMLACNRNGVMGTLAYAKDSVEIWKTPNKNNDSTGWIGIFNRSSSKVQNFSFNLSDIGLGTCTLFDIWNNKSLGIVNNAIRKPIAADGVLFYKYTEVDNTNKVNYSLLK